MHAPTSRLFAVALRSCAAAFVCLAALPGAALAVDLTIAQSTDAVSLDPAFRADTATGNVQRHIFDTILQRGPDMTIGPQLAETVRQDGPTQWTVVLRPGLKFSNGEPLDAEAVKFSIERMQNPGLKSPIRGWWTGFKTVEVADERTLKITTTAADPLFRARMTLLAPVPPKYVRDAGDAAFARKPVGSGPYRLVDWRRDDAVVLQANPDYAGQKPKIDRVVFRVVPEELSRVAALQTGEADVIAGMSPTQAAGLETSPDARVERAASTRVMAVQFDIDEPPGNEQKFRDAVAYAIDRDAIIKGLLRGYAVPAKSILSPGIPEWPSDKDFTRKYDLDKAKALVKELGLEGREIVMRTSSGRYPNDRETALAIGAQLQKAGLNVKVRPEEWGTFFEDLKNHKMSALYLSGQGNVWLDPYPQIEAFHTTNGLLSAWSDPTIDALLAKSNEVPVEQRPALFEQMLERLRDTTAAVPLYAQQIIYGVRKGVDWKPRSDEQILAFEMSKK
ncbi:ABC transporter substrate-binding protein [Alsobacter sp. SYSU M60028]|uniref:ABC transporter substrate-binding protein n=1 Tax=Alsobacter ponti TaxID=2962936 RepID=A0ABT1L9T5_9HYPH|nr:ABC transporter substrate-binding protein [Alsobacter ponti]MCP8938249.1 ABC transporter substrate-binding protein [Alsobacter ponti]